MTETLLKAISDSVWDFHASRQGAALPAVDRSLFTGQPLPQLSFIPTLEAEIRKQAETLAGWTIPDLADAEGASKSLIATLEKLDLPVPVSRSVPRLLDALSSEFLEPLCKPPTWITHHPECMAPLAKSFDMELEAPGQGKASSPARSVRVAARAELFIDGREYVNCYEEENSPVEQRRKFVEQAKHHDRTARSAEDGQGISDAAHYDAPIDAAEADQGAIDESYISALEWGMPPTGGWGCGVDRLVMLFAGKKRIADVLSFGTLNNVVALGSGPAKAGGKRTQ